MKMTKEQYRGIVLRDGYNLRHVPLELRTYELCLEAVKGDGWSLEFVPLLLRSKALCISAVKENGRAYNFVPLDLKDDYQICYFASISCHLIFRKIPKSFHNDNNFCCRVLKKNMYVQLVLDDMNREKGTIDYDAVGCD